MYIKNIHMFRKINIIIFGRENITEFTMIRNIIACFTYVDRILFNKLAALMLFACLLMLMCMTLL